MDDAPRHREYRSARASEKGALRLRLGVGLLALAAGAVAWVWDLTRDETPVAVPVATGALCAATLVFTFVFANRVLASATISDEHGLTAQGVFRTRSTPWPDVHDIRVEDVTTAAETNPRRGIVLYDAAGGRYALPYLDDITLTSDDLDRETAFLHGEWLRYRGEGWEPRRAAVDEAASRAVRRKELGQHWLILFYTAPLALIVGMLILAGALAAGVYSPIGEPQRHPVVEALFHPVTLLAGLPAVYVVGYLLLLLRKARAGKNADTATRGGT